MIVNVADFRANPNENIVHAATVIGRSEARRAVFEAIYRGKKKEKTVDDLMAATNLSHVRVLQEGGKLAANGLVEQTSVGGRTAYRKYDFYSHNKRKVLGLVDHPERRSRYPTKQEPRVSAAGVTYQITVPRSQHLPTEITVDDIDAFAQVKRVPTPPAGQNLSDIPEARVKEFLKRVIGETHEFRDWGGEKNDLFTNKLRFRGHRRAAAFAIKGKATSGPLTPKKMGTNGDQVGRLGTSEAQMFFVVYHGKVDQSIHEQLRVYGIARALAGNRVYYCVIDGDDLGRLIAAYEKEFEQTA
jgi:hypothetical protein